MRNSFNLLLVALAVYDNTYLVSFTHKYPSPEKIT